MKIVFLFLGDLLILYLALFTALSLRAALTAPPYSWQQHIAPFTLVFMLWVLVFSLAGLYDLRRQRNTPEFLKSFLASLGLNAAIAIGFFYFLPGFGITPKTVLLLFLLVFSVLWYVWRLVFNAYSGTLAPDKIILLGEVNPDTTALVDCLMHNPQLGYVVTAWIRPGRGSVMAAKLAAAVTAAQNECAIVIPAALKKNETVVKAVYAHALSGASVIDFAGLYENIFKKIPLSEAEEIWFLENAARRHRLYAPFKRAFDFLLALCLFLVTLPFFVLVAILVRLTSRGPVILAQKRIGRSEKFYTHYKFRSMIENAPATWFEEAAAPLTPVGKFLRRTHLDELPQLINIIRGDLSLTGPRPDFADFFQNLKKQIPFYSIRTLVPPGLSGWAQVCYPVTASLEETRERLSYDLYYLKNYSPILDVIIVFKTIKVTLLARGR